MSFFYLITLAALLLAALVRGLAVPVRMYQYPYFMAAVFAAFILPQAMSLVNYRGEASPQAVEAVLLMTLLCVVACFVGYRAPESSWLVERCRLAVDDQRLFHVGVLFICCGFFFTILIGQMSSAERGGGQWMGRATIYLFFANLNFPGLAICLREALKRGHSTAWFWTVAGSAIPLVAAIFHGRREPAALYLLTLALTLFFQRGQVFRRWVMVTGLVAATLLIHGMTQYRMTVGREGVAAVTEIDFVGNLQQLMQYAPILEFRNAAMLIEATERTGQFGWGRGYWDTLVFRFVPGQIVGHDLKEGLMFSSTDAVVEREFAVMGYDRIIGTTVTGMGDAFQEFWYFGALFFAVLAVIFKGLWRAALQNNGVFAQLLYIQTITGAMLAITHQTANYLPELTYNLIFLGLAVAYARVPRVGPAKQAAMVRPQ